MKKTRTLIVDDDPYIREGIRDVLEHEGYETLEAGDGKTALDLLDDEPIDLLLLDLELPRVPGMRVLETLMERKLDIPVIIISGKGSIPTAVESMKLGALDFIEKPVDAQRILTTVRNILDRISRQRAHRLSLDEAFTRYAMVGTSTAIHTVYEAIDRAAATKAKVLIIGESGTGKEIVAAAIHRLGPPPDRAFIAVNCAAIPETLIESELFGHTAGAFTGARVDHKGSLELAHKGTLFLDEVGDMSLMMQAKLLRALETKEFRRVGGERTIHSDFRVIAATNKNLLGEVERGNFREDLYYRLSVITITVPPLRERTEDIDPLAEFFIRRTSSNNGTSPDIQTTTGAKATLRTHAWPGNVRELGNTIERLIVMNPGTILDARQVRDAIQQHETPTTANDPRQSLKDARTQFEREFIIATLDSHEWRIRDTAESLGIDRSHLWKKMRLLGIDAVDESEGHGQ